MDQRVEFVMRAQRGGEGLAGLCREHGVSRPTGYLWLGRYREVGSISALGEHSRRPLHTPRRTESAVEGAVLQLRDEKGWGARKLAKMLSLRGIKVAPATAHRILKRAGRVVEPAVDKTTTRFERAECNELAQMDFKGEYTLPSQQKCYPLSFLMTAAAICMGCGP